MLYRVAVIAVLAALALATPPAQAAFPGANGKIAFSGHTINPDGSGLSSLPGFNSSWSPDGRKLVFPNDDAPDCGFSLCYSLHVINADGSGHSTVPNTQGPVVQIYDVSWTADGTGFIYSEDFAGDAQRITKINADGTGKSALTYLGGDQNPVHLNASPDGHRFAYSTTFGNGSQSHIYTDSLDAPGSPTQLATGYFPNWSPDGTRITFTKDNEIYVMDADGTDQTRLTSNTLTDEKSAWSPDGSKIVFQRHIPPCGPPQGCGDLFIVNADGSAETFLAQGHFPDWQPLRGLEPFPRPGGGTPLVVYLVPAFEQCTAPNSQHVAPLAEGSCEPPIQVSDLLTTSKVGQGKGQVRLDSVAGNISTALDEADFKIVAQLSDVRRASDQSDYTGSVLLTSTLRITDRASGFGGVSATVSDFRFDVPIACTASVPAPIGSDCSITTSADALVAGMIREGKRSVISTPRFAVLDAGPDGSLSAPSCPPTCGTGDESEYLVQGTFTP